MVVAMLPAAPAFMPLNTITQSVNPWDVAATDFVQDGILDLAVVNFVHDLLTLYSGLPDGTVGFRRTR